MSATFNPLDYETLFVKPRRLTPYSEWQAHIPFGMVLVSLVKPQVLVELGSQAGDSYCALCQAVQILELDTSCYAVDTWIGDEQTGFYGPEILDDLRAHHDPLYGSFSQLIQGTFDEALVHFMDGSIDLLHIDGLHTHEAVKHDWDLWLPKMSPRGIVMFHDINERHSDFGVWQLWSEVKVDRPHFEFHHGHGLGVVSVGDDCPEGLIPLLEAPPDLVVRARSLFHQIGQSIAEGARGAYTDKEKRLAREASRLREVEDRIHRENYLAALESERSRLEASVAALESERSRLEASFAALESERSRLEASVAALESERSRLEASVAGHEEEYKRLEADRERIETERGKLEQTAIGTERQLNLRTGELEAARAKELRQWVESRRFVERLRLVLPWRWGLLERAMRGRW